MSNLIKQITRLLARLRYTAILIAGVVFTFSQLAISETLKLEPQFKYLITTGPGAGQFIVGTPPHIVLTGIIKYYDTPEDAFLEYPAYLEQLVAPIGEMTFQRVSNFRPAPNSGIVNGKYDSYCWDIYREVNGISVEPLSCTGDVWMKPFCPEHYHLEHTYYREGSRFIHHYDCAPGEKSEPVNARSAKKQEPEKQKIKP
ncbi:MAG TPA: hypothetical protein VGC12_01240 [Methyloradius sp.]